MGEIHIFLADDDQDDRELFEEVLTDTGMPLQLTFLEDGAALMTLLAKIDQPPPPDVIFLDINMPRMNGKSCLREIRDNKKFNHIPVFMFSTSVHPKDIEETYAAGATLYISKTDFFTSKPEQLKTVLSHDWKNESISRSLDRFLFKMDN